MQWMTGGFICLILVLFFVFVMNIFLTVFVCSYACKKTRYVNTYQMLEEDYDEEEEESVQMKPLKKMKGTTTTKKDYNMGRSRRRTQNV